MSRPTAPRSRVAAVAAVLGAALSLSACSGGAIAANTPASNGQSFVSGNGVTVFGRGKGPVAPHVSGTTLTGAKLSLSDYAGHVVVMNFWGSWCPPCRAEAPALASLARSFGARGVRFLGVDIRDNTPSATAFLSDNHIGYPSLSDPGGQIALAFRGAVTPAAIPTTLVIARDGRIAARVVGQVSYSGLKGLISQTLARSS